MKRLQGRVAVVTGAARGIGAAIADELSRHGATVVRVDKLPLNGAHTFALDVADRGAVEALPTRVAQAVGPPSILVNNAGVSLGGRFADTELADIDWIMGVNFFGAVAMTKAFLPHLLASDEGHIVNVLSSFALAGFAGKSGYASSKFALRGFTESLYAELHGTRVGVTALYPGPVDTGLVREGRAEPSQREAEARFVARRAISRERVARATVRAIRRNQLRVRLSVDYALIDWVTRLAPTLALKLLARAPTPF
jgi:short-subunit dehydrogenase